MFDNGGVVFDEVVVNVKIVVGDNRVDDCDAVGDGDDVVVSGDEGAAGKVILVDMRGVDDAVFGDELEFCEYVIDVCGIVVFDNEVDVCFEVLDCDDVSFVTDDAVVGNDVEVVSDDALVDGDNIVVFCERLVTVDDEVTLSDDVVDDNAAVVAGAVTVDRLALVVCGESGAVADDVAVEDVIVSKGGLLVC